MSPTGRGPVGSPSRIQAPQPSASARGDVAQWHLASEEMEKLLDAEMGQPSPRATRSSWRVKSCASTAEEMIWRS